MRFLTVENSRKKTAHLILLTETKKRLSLCEVTGYEKPVYKEREHIAELHEEIPEGYYLCKACMNRAYEAGLLEVKYTGDRELVRVKGGYQLRPLTVEEYKERRENEE